MECKPLTATNVADYTVSINDFLFSVNIDNINLVKLLSYLKESSIVRKVNMTDSVFCFFIQIGLNGHPSIKYQLTVCKLNLTILILQISGYGDALNSSVSESIVSKCKEATDDESAINGFRALYSMLHSLTNNDGDGRMIVTKAKSGCSEQGGSIKYVMLTGQKIFSEVYFKFLVYKLQCLFYSPKIVIWR